MNVGVCISHQTGGMRDSIASAADLGFKHCQLVSWLPALWTQTEAESLTRLLEEYHITITAFWCGWEGPHAWDFISGPETLGLVPPTYRYARIKNLCDGADFARLLGVTDVISHMGFIPEALTDWNYPGTVEALRVVALHCVKNEQKLLFETGQETPITLLRTIEDIGTGNVYINLDPANLILYGKANPVDSLETFGAWIRGVHAKDGLYPTKGRALGQEVKIGEGKVDFPALLNGLKALGYDGSLTIEHEIEVSLSQRHDDVRAAKDYLESLIRTL